MAAFDQTTSARLTGSTRGIYTAEIDPAWCVWSPAGGYLMALCLRAAGHHSECSSPISFACHFLAAPALGPAEVRVETLRRTRVAESVRIHLRQGDRVALEALAWCGDPVEGYEHLDARPPAVPRWDQVAARALPRGQPGFQSFWQHLEQRPCGPLHWERDRPSEPRQRDWIRLLGFDADSDAFAHAARAAIVLDAFTWPAAAHAHAKDSRYIAPTMSFSIDFHQTTPSDWLLSDASAPTAGRGLIGIHNRLFGVDGELVASGNGTLTCRPRPGRG